MARTMGQRPRRMRTRTCLVALVAVVTSISTGGQLVQGSNRVSVFGDGSGSGSSGGGGQKQSVNDTHAVKAEFNTMSGIGVWVDPATPEDRQVYVTSRGEQWELVMSDEFNNVNRNFTPGGDHLWTSLEKPDGVNGAVELYAHNQTYVACEDMAADGSSKSKSGGADADNTTVCSLVIKAEDKVTNITVYNQYSRPPGYQTVTFYYRAAMLQTWNKFCYQGGMVEVRAQLPGAISKKSQNPDIAGGPNARTTDIEYYPTWPGIWLLGNLGRAIFSGSTSRMWPFTYDQCEPDVFDPASQRISACNDSPGHGLNPNQGRGAPEIDILEGGGLAISSSIQIGPGVKKEFRMFPVNESLPGEFGYCLYGGSCKTPGANLPNVPTKLYAERGYQTWYKGLRYAANNFCNPRSEDKQSFAQVNASLTAGITENACTVATCPGSRDVQSDLGYIDGDPSNPRWGINSEGTCYSFMNTYMGSFLCDPDNTNKDCETPRNSSTPKTNTMEPFAYQMDALSANWDVHVGAYTEFLTYQVEWVLGNEYGYLRWMLDSHPIFEIPAETVVKGPQAKNITNPTLTFIEEPMYIILNVALSSQWGATPPNRGETPCRGDGKNAKNNRICDEFPMYMKVDYVRVYQDTTPNSNMSIGCDPASHPTRQYILDNRELYEDDVNVILDVSGGAPCRDDLDCMIPINRTMTFRTGFCVKSRCQCSSEYWSGPRCTTELVQTLAENGVKEKSFGPPLYIAIAVGAIAFVLTFFIMILCTHRRRLRDAELQEKLEKIKAKMDMEFHQTMDVEKASLLPTDFDEVEFSRITSSTPNAGYQPMAKPA